MPETEATEATGAIGDPAAARLYAYVGSKIRNRRVAEERTQEDLAARVGMARTSLTNLERGRQHIPLHTLMRLASELDLELADLMPSMADLTAHSSQRVPMQIDGQTRLVPPRAATAISDTLASSRRSDMEMADGNT